MNKEIKFRAWSPYWKPAFLDGKPEAAMEYFGLSDLHSGYTPNADIGVDEVDVVVMQYTGLKDKNGKEIYEGDKMKTMKGVVFNIIWSPKSARWVGITPNIWTDNVYVGDKIYKSLPYLAERAEVIGNIYESKGLLKDS